MAGALFGEVLVSLSVAGAVLGEGQVSLLSWQVQYPELPINLSRRIKLNLWKRRLTKKKTSIFFKKKTFIFLIKKL